MAGRLSSSFANDVARATAVPFEFVRDGAVTAAPVSGRRYNATDVPLRVERVAISAGTAPTGGPLTVDVLVNGVSVFADAGSRVKIAASAFYGEAEANKPADVRTVLPKTGYVTVVVTGIGTTVAGSDLQVQVFAGGLDSETLVDPNG